MSNHGILEEELIHSDTPKLDVRLEHRIVDLRANKPEFHLTMLEPSGTEKKRRAASASISLFLQCVLIGSLLVIPLMITDTLPTRQLVTFLVAPPPPPPPPPPVPAAALKRTAVTSNIVDGHLKMPSRIPRQVQMIHEEAAPPSGIGVVGGVEGGIPGGQLKGVIGGIVSSSSSSVLPPPKPVIPQRLRISQGVSSGRINYRVEPRYPLIAQQARIEGAVVLSAVISKQGTIENLQVLSGHPLLVQSAISAVAQWRYRPYLLNGEPVEVETTITVNFKLNG